jgi:hypothetical protein
VSVLAFSALLVVLVVLSSIAFGPELGQRGRAMLRRLRPRRRPESIHLPDPGVELRAERRAEQLLLEVVGTEAFETCRVLGFLSAFGPPGAGGEPEYGYLIYPHRPIVSFDARSGELLSEHCVTFTDPERGPDRGRLPAADDVLAKWMALRGDERGLISEANMHVPGRQLDPAQVRRDVARLSEWTARSGGQLQLDRDA